MAKWLNVYHTTGFGNADIIVKDGWKIQRQFLRGQLYGQGIYFWEREDDAKMFGELYYPKSGYDILMENIPYRNVLSYDFKMRNPNNQDAGIFSRRMIGRGYELVEIRSAYMDDTTMKQAKGKAYVWLVDVNVSYLKIS